MSCFITHFFPINLPSVLDFVIPRSVVCPFLPEQSRRLHPTQLFPSHSPQLAGNWSAEYKRIAVSVALALLLASLKPFGQRVVIPGSFTIFCLFPQFKATVTSCELNARHNGVDSLQETSFHLHVRAAEDGGREPFHPHLCAAVFCLFAWHMNRMRHE